MGCYFAGDSDDVDCWVDLANIITGYDKWVVESTWCGMSEVVLQLISQCWLSI